MSPQTAFRPQTLVSASVPDHRTHTQPIGSKAARDRIYSPSSDVATSSLSSPVGGSSVAASGGSTTVECVRVRLWSNPSAVPSSSRPTVDVDSNLSLFFDLILPVLDVSSRACAGSWSIAERSFEPCSGCAKTSETLGSPWLLEVDMVRLQRPGYAE